MQDRAANANARARVSKDEDKQVHSPSCFETHRRAVSAVEGRGPAWRCGAPQHEGRERAHFGETQQDACLARARTNLRV
jgi:hypothetical protein